MLGPALASLALILRERTDRKRANRRARWSQRGLSVLHKDVKEVIEGPLLFRAGAKQLAPIKHSMLLAVHPVFSLNSYHSRALCIAKGC